MKTLQIFNLLVVALLLGLFWFADQNSKALSQYSQSEAMFSAELEKHTQAVLSGEKKENVDHLIAVIQKISATSSSGSKNNSIACGFYKRHESSNIEFANLTNSNFYYVLLAI